MATGDELVAITEPDQETALRDAIVGHSTPRT